MTATQMTASQVHRFIRFCEDQGIKVLRTKKGLMIRFPDGTSTVQHFTTSDVRALQNQISVFRRAGMVHPNDTRAQKDLPSYITGGTISHKTRQRILDLVEQLGYPDTVYSSTVVKETTMDPTSANRALFHSGFRPGPAKSKRVGRPWYTPTEILELKDNSKTEAEVPVIRPPDPEVERALAEIVDDAGEQHEEAVSDVEALTELAKRAGAAQEAVNNMGFGVPEPEPTVPREPVPEVIEVTKEQAEQVEHVYFLDDRDSWSVDMEDVLGEHLYRMVRERMSVLTAVGLEYEVRVWRTK
jgi:hypothetical protein